MWLKMLRENARLTQDELAARLQLQGQDVSRASISHWETGRYEPPMRDARFRRALATSLEISITDLLIAAGFEYVTEFSDVAGKAAQIVESLPPDRQDLALRLLEQLSAS